MTDERKRYLALAGGVGGARLLDGLANLLDADELVCVVNTGDDFEHLGLHISPDLDTVTYTLAGINNPEMGWGIAGETWQVMAEVASLGGPAWFRLGDRDLATHLVRTGMLKQGMTLTAVTRHIAGQLGVSVPVLPMSDDPVATIVQTIEGDMPFQEYFVHRQCEPSVTGFRFHGIQSAQPAAAMMELLADKRLAGVIICPSNPFVSIDPILGLPGVRAALQASPAPVVAVSPLVGNRAFKGPTSKMMQELGQEAGPQQVVKHYDELLSGFVLHHTDTVAETLSCNRHLQWRQTDISLTTLEDRTRVAKVVLEILAELQ